MADIFNRKTDAFGGAFSADMGTVTFTGANADGTANLGMLVQNLSGNYTQQITRLYEVSSNKIYYVAGRTAGAAGIGRIIGPSALAAAFYTKYGDVCNAASNTLMFQAKSGCGTSFEGNSTFGMHFVVINSINISVGAMDMLINEQLSMMFSSLQYN